MNAVEFGGVSYTVCTVDGRRDVDLWGIHVEMTEFGRLAWGWEDGDLRGGGGLHGLHRGGRGLWECGWV